MDNRPGDRDPPGVPRALGRLRIALNDSFTDASHSLGLTPQQAELLCWAMRPRAVGELAQLLHCDRSNVSRMVDRAGARGLLARRAERRDGRVSMIELTPTGQRVAEEFIAKLESLTAPLLDSWSVEQRLAAAQTLNALAETLESPPPPAEDEESDREGYLDAFVGR
jgi:DNA-binding MarR family transcriptional regulator